MTGLGGEGLSRFPLLGAKSRPRAGMSQSKARGSGRGDWSERSRDGAGHVTEPAPPPRPGHVTETAAPSKLGSSCGGKGLERPRPRAGVRALLRTGPARCAPALAPGGARTQRRWRAKRRWACGGRAAWKRTAVGGGPAPAAREAGGGAGAAQAEPWPGPRRRRGKDLAFHPGPERPGGSRGSLPRRPAASLLFPPSWAPRPGRQRVLCSRNPKPRRRLSHLPPGRGRSPCLGSGPSPRLRPGSPTPDPTPACGTSVGEPGPARCQPQAGPAGMQWPH